MPETSREIFLELRGRIDHVLLTDWTKYISRVTAAYATAFNSVSKLLEKVKAEETARREKEQALMVTTLSILTGGIVGAMADGFVKRLPALEKTVYTMEGGFIKATKVAVEDPILYKVFKDTTKDLVKRGIGVVSDLGLDQFKGTPPSSGFEPVGMLVEEYRDLLTQGIIDRASFLWNFVDALYQGADLWPAEVADMLRKGLYQNEFFQLKYRAPDHFLENKAELALWSAWALPRDDDYWETQRALTRTMTNTEALSWASIQDELVKLGVPEDQITVVGVQTGFRRNAVVKGLDVLGFKDWVKTTDFTHTLYEGIPIAGGSMLHWALTKMHQAYRILGAAA